MDDRKIKRKNKVKTQNLWGLLKNGKTEAHYMYVAITEDYQLISESKGEYYSKLAMKFSNPKTYNLLLLSLKHFIMFEKYQ